MTLLHIPVRDRRRRGRKRRRRVRRKRRGGGGGGGEGGGGGGEGGGGGGDMVVKVTCLSNTLKYLHNGIQLVSTTHTHAHTHTLHTYIPRILLCDDTIMM